MFSIAIDPLFPPPATTYWNKNKTTNFPMNILESNKFELIFDEKIDFMRINKSSI